MLSRAHESLAIEQARELSRMLSPLRFRVDRAASVERARQELLAAEYDVVLTEAQLSDGKWLDVLHLVRDSSHAPAVIVSVETNSSTAPLHTNHAPSTIVA